MSTNFLEALEASAKLPAEADSSLSVASQIRRRLPDIEAALARGFTHRQILQQLNRDGIDLTAAYYHRLIPKLRSEARATGAIFTVSGVHEHVAQSNRASSEMALEPLADPLLAAQAPAAAPANTKSDDLSSTVAAPAVVKPRTIPGGKASGPKFPWDPKGAEKFDPDKL